MNLYKFFLIFTASGLIAAGLGFSPARVRAEAPPVLPGIVLDRGQIGTELNLGYFSGAKYFNSQHIGKEDPGGFDFSEGKTTVGLSYGLTGALTLGLSLPVIRRSYSEYFLWEDIAGTCYGEGVTTTYTFISAIPNTLRKTGIGDVSLEAKYRVAQLPGPLPDLAARLSAKLPVGSNKINMDRGEINLGDGQSDLYFGISGKGERDYFLYDFSLDYRLRFAGSYSYIENQQTWKFGVDPGDEFRAQAGAYLVFRQLTLGGSANYISMGKSRTWLKNISEAGMGAGYYFQITPAVSLQPSPSSVFSFSVEVPVVGKNYPADSPNLLLPGYFDYRWSLDFQYRI